MNTWVKVKLEQVAIRGYNCEYCGAYAGEAIQAHHGPFGRDVNHPEYDCKENLILLDYRCNNDRVLDNLEGREWSLWHNVGIFGIEHMREWLESLKATHKDHTDINCFLRVLEE